MIRLRTASGNPIPVPPESTFVELVDATTGKLGCVLYSPTPGTVLTIWPGSPDASRYEGLFQRHGLRFVDQIIQPSTP